MRMTITARLLLFISLLILILLGCGQTGLTKECRLRLMPGEKLEYQVYGKGLPIGEQTLSIIREISYQDQPVFHVRLHLKSYSAYAFFFSYQETTDLYLHSKQLTPLYLKKKIIEKDKVWEEEYFFGTETVEKIVRTAGREERLSSYQVKHPLVENLSLIYYLRARPWEQGQYHLYYLTSKGSMFVEYQHKGEERVKALSSSIKAEVIFDPVSQVTIWFSKDEKVYPLRIMVKKDFGVLTSRLVKTHYIAE